MFSAGPTGFQHLTAKRLSRPMDTNRCILGRNPRMLRQLAKVSFRQIDYSERVRILRLEVAEESHDTAANLLFYFRTRALAVGELV